MSVGFAAGEIPRIPLNLVLLKGAHVRGFELRGVMENVPGAVRRGDAALTQLVAGGMRPYVSSIHPLERVRDALDEVAGRRALGKVVVSLRRRGWGYGSRCLTSERTQKAEVYRCGR